MPAELDVYRDWLGVTDPARPLNHYQLLRLKKFEDDAAQVRAHYRKLNAHVRKFAAGEFASQSQSLLNELAKAMLCLTDDQRKREYDAALGRPTGQEHRRLSLEELLLRRQVIDREQLEKARRFADAVGLELGDAVVQQKLAKPEVVMQLVAESLGLPYVELADVGVYVEMVPHISALLARQNSCVPVMIDDGTLLMASPRPINPTVEDELRLRLGMPVRSVLCTAAAINAAISEHFPQDRAAAELAAQGTSPSKPGAAAANVPLSPEARRQRLLITFMAFNFTFMGLMIYQTSFRLPPQGFLSAATLAVPAGLVAAGLAFVGLKLSGR